MHDVTYDIVYDVMYDVIHDVMYDIMYDKFDAMCDVYDVVYGVMYDVTMSALITDYENGDNEKWLWWLWSQIMITGIMTRLW